MKKYIIVIYGGQNYLGSNLSEAAYNANMRSTDMVKFFDAWSGWATSKEQAEAYSFVDIKYLGHFHVEDYYKVTYSKGK